MTRYDLTKIVSENMKMLRAEYGYSQQEMANAIGLSKKTLIQIEKDRLELGWTAVCAVCAGFKGSKLLHMTLGEDPATLAETLAHENCYAYEEAESRNLLFWDVVKSSGGYSLQKNIISEHYRIVDKHGRRLFSSLNIDKVNIAFEKYLEKGEKENVKQ